MACLSTTYSKKLITCLKKEQEDFIKQQPWMCVFCNHINTHGTTKCAGVWKGTTPLPHTKFGSLANNQQYFLWGGEKNGECKFPPSVSLFKHKEWKADFQKKKIYTIIINMVYRVTLRDVYITLILTIRI